MIAGFLSCEDHRTVWDFHLTINFSDKHNTMGKGKHKQKLALKVSIGGTMKARINEDKTAKLSDGIDPKVLRKVVNQKATKAVNSSFQRQVLALQERNYKNIQFNKHGSGPQIGTNIRPQAEADVCIAPATFVVPTRPEERPFSATDALLMGEKANAPAVSVDTSLSTFFPNAPKAQENPLANNPFSGLDEDNAETAPSINIAPPTFTFSSSISQQISDDDI